MHALLTTQSISGGWGAHHVSAEETGYALIALNMLAHSGQEGRQIDEARARGEYWLVNQYRANEPVLDSCWQAKEIYRPYRIARTYELAAALQSRSIESSFQAYEREVG